MAARRSASVHRVIGVLDFFAHHANEWFNLSEVARGVGFNYRTTQGIVNTLTDEGFVVFDDTQGRYGLGASVIGIGQASISAKPAPKAGPFTAQITGLVQSETE